MAVFTIGISHVPSRYRGDSRPLRSTHDDEPQKLVYTSSRNSIYEEGAGSVTGPGSCLRKLGGISERRIILPDARHLCLPLSLAFIVYTL